MGILRLAKYAMMWTAKTLVIGSLTFAFHDQIQDFVYSVRYYLNREEPGFVTKDQGFHLKFGYEINGKTNLETYLRNYTQRLPVYRRENGLMTGSAPYNFSNFTYEEKTELCSGKIIKSKPIEEPKKKESKIKKPLKIIDDLLKEEG